MTHTVFIDLALELARKANTGTEQPQVGLKIRTAQTIAFAFMTSGVVAAVAGWTSGKCVIKAQPTSPVLLIDTTLDTDGSGSDTRYKAVWTAATLDGPTDGALRQFLGDSPLPKECWCEVEWIDAAGTHSVSFPITLIPTLNDPEDEAPSPTDSASWEWLKQRAPDANGFTHDDEAKTLGVPSVAAQTTAAAQKSAPADADKVPLIDSAAQGVLKWLSWTNIKATLKAYFDGIYSTFSGAWADLSGKPATFPPSTHSHAITDITSLQGALDAKIPSTQRGANNGVAPLDSGGKVPAANLPSYVDDVIEAANFAALPGTGEASKIYVALDNGKTYRWSGSGYVALNELPAFASQAEAEAGSNNSTLMTPLRTAEAIAALATGGGGALVRGYGTLSGHTSAGSAASPPADLQITFNGFADGSFTLNLNGSYIAFDFQSYAGSGVWIDNSTLSTYADFANALASAINGQGITGIVASVNADTCTIASVSTGSSAAVQVAASSYSQSSYGGGGTGTDAISPSGAVQEVTLIPVSGVKSVLPVKIAFSSDGAMSGTLVQVCLKVGVDYYPVAALINGVMTYGDVVPFTYWSEWVTPRISSSLIARYEDTPPVGGSMTIFAICEQQAF